MEEKPKRKNDELLTSDGELLEVVYDDPAEEVRSDTEAMVAMMADVIAQQSGEKAKNEAAPSDEYQTILAMLLFLVLVGGLVMAINGIPTNSESSDPVVEFFTGIKPFVDVLMDGPIKFGLAFGMSISFLSLIASFFTKGKLATGHQTKVRNGNGRNGIKKG